MTALESRQTMSPEAMDALRQELVAWELREARIYGEDLTPAAAAAKVNAGLLRILAA